MRFRRDSGLGAAKAFGEGLVQAVARILRERRRLGIAVDIDCFFRGVHDKAALLAFEEMLFEGSAQRRIEFFVEITFEFCNHCLAIH